MRLVVQVGFSLPFIVGGFLWLILDRSCGSEIGQP